MNNGMHQIGEVAEATGLSLRTIRHYEEVDLVPPSGRTTGGFHLYTEDDIERLLLIKQMKPLDFTLEELRQLLDARDRLHEEPDGTSERERLQEQLRMSSELAEVRCDSLRSQLRQQPGGAQDLVPI